MPKGTDIGKAYVQIVPSAEGISGSISNVLKGESNNAGTTAGNSITSKIISIIGKAGIGIAIYKTIKSAISEGSDLEQSLGGIETLFKDSSDKMKQYASEAYKTAGLSANDYMEQATSFAAALIKSTGDDTEKAADAANQAMIDMADNSNKMGTSIDAIQNAYQGFAKQNYTMLDNLKLGYGGTKTEMQRLLKDAQAITGVKYDINNLSDVYEAIHIIQGELGITGTTATEASTTMTGSLNAMKSAFSNLLGNIALGEDIKPSLQALVETTGTFLLDNLIPMVVNIAKQLPEAILNMIETAAPLILEKIPQLMDNILLYLQESLPKLIEQGIGIINNIGQGIVQQTPDLLNKALDIILTIAQGILDNLPVIIENGINIVVTLAKSIIDTLPDLFNKVFNAVKSIRWLDIGKAIINGIIDGVKSLISSLINTVVNAAKSAWNAVKDFLGIHSPSKKFRYIGENMALGLGMGYANAMPDVIDDINKSTSLITSDISTDLNATIKPEQSKRINNLEISFSIDNSGKDITDNDIERWSSLMFNSINKKLGGFV